MRMSGERLAAIDRRFPTQNSGELIGLASVSMPLALYRCATTRQVPWGGEGSRKTRLVVKLSLGYAGAWKPRPGDGTPSKKPPRTSTVTVYRNRYNKTRAALTTPTTAPRPRSRPRRARPATRGARWPPRPA